MPEPSASGLTSPPSQSPYPSPTTSEVVHRPDPGTLARGRWEAPSWAFYVAAAAIVILAAVYAALRLGLFRRFARRSAAKR